MEDSFDEAEQQLEFLSEIQATTGRSAEVAYLMGFLAWRQRQDKEQEVERLTEAVDIHFRNIKGFPLGYVHNALHRRLCTFATYMCKLSTLLVVYAHITAYCKGNSSYANAELNTLSSSTQISY